MGWLGHGCLLESRLHRALAADAFSRKAFNGVALRSKEGVPILVNLFNSSRLRLVKPGASRRDEARIV